MRADGLARMGKWLVAMLLLCSLGASPQQQFLTGKTPASYQNLQLWLDPYDTSSMALRHVAAINTIAPTTQKQSLQRQGRSNDAFNFATNSAFSMAGWWFVGDDSNTYTVGTSNCLVAKNNPAAPTTNAAWWLVLNSTSNLAFGAATSNAAVASVNCSGVTFNSGQWYHIACSFNGAGGANDTNKLVCYVNGAALTTASGTTLPTTLQNPSSGSVNLNFGNYNTGGSYGEQRYSDWGFWDGLVFTATDVTNLYNNGAGVTYSTLPSGGSNLKSPMAYYSMTEPSGNRLDSTTNHYDLIMASADGTPIGSRKQVVSWTDKSGALGAFSAGDGPQASFQYKRIREPRYDPNAWGKGLPGIRMNPNNWLYNGTAGWQNGIATGAIWQNIQVSSALSVNEGFFLSSSDDLDASHERLFMTGYDGPAVANLNIANVYCPQLRINDGLGNGTGIGNGQPQSNIITVTKGSATIAGNQQLSASQLFSFEYACVDSTTYGSQAVAGSWRMKVNGVDQTVYVNDGGAANSGGAWMQLASGRSCQMLNGFYNGGYQAGIGPVTIYGDAVSQAPVTSEQDRASLAHWMMGRAGITGPLSPLTQLVTSAGTYYITSNNVSVTGTTSTLILPPVAPCNGQTLMIKNNGSGTTTINADAGSDITASGSTTGVSSFTLTTGQNTIIVSDGTLWNRAS